MNPIKTRYSILALASIAAMSVTACGNPDGGTNQAFREEAPLSPPPNQELQQNTTESTTPPNQKP